MATKPSLREISLSKLRPGLRLSSPVIGVDGRKLIGCGVAITSKMLEEMELRGIRTVAIEESAVEELHSKVRLPPASVHEPLTDERCQKCGLPLPLKYLADAEPTLTWVCAACNASYRAVLDTRSSPEYINNVRLMKFEFDRQRLIAVPERIASAVRSLTEKPYDGPERRGSKRMNISIAVPVIPVDENFVAVGEPFMLMTRNISTGGISLIHSRPIRPKFLVLELAPPGQRLPVQLVVEVVRCRPLGSVHEIAGRFVVKSAN